jgi:tripartite ATP-independent transporter DctM subunit
MTMTEFALFGAFGGLLLLGMPLAFAIGMAVLLALWTEGLDLIVLPQQLMAGVSVYALLAVPCFILAGDLMYTGGLSRRLVNLAMVLLGRLHGGVAIVAVLSATMFGAITGSANATTAAIGQATIPEMVRRGYSPEFSTALAAAYGPIGILIPPSIPMIIWAVIANESVTKLFVAGILPGLLMCVGLMAMSYIHARRNGIPVQAGRFSGRDLRRALIEGKWSLLAPVVILGGIYGGVFTPTEAGAIGVFYGLAVGLLYRELKLADVPAILLRSLKTTTIVIYIFGMAAAFSWLLGYNGVPAKIGEALLGLSDEPVVILLLLNLLLLAVGSFMDELAAIIILSTFLIHVGHTLGIDPIHFGIIIVTNVAVGLATPPVGYTLFTASAVSGAPIERVIRPLLPLIAVEIAVLLLITYVPGVSTFFLRFL